MKGLDPDGKYFVLRLLSRSHVSCVSLGHMCFAASTRKPATPISMSLFRNSDCKEKTINVESKTILTTELWLILKLSVSTSICHKSQASFVTSATFLGYLDSRFV